MQQRELKFRVWDNVDYMSKPFTLHSLMSPERTEFTAECKVMQYTGMKDRNGVEMYEGDVVVVDGLFDYETGQTEKDILVVMYDGPLLTYQSLYANEGESGREIIRVSDLIGHGCDADDCVEVIGNIYEHSHLIEP